MFKKTLDMTKDVLVIATLYYSLRGMAEMICEIRQDRINSKHHCSS